MKAEGRVEIDLIQDIIEKYSLQLTLYQQMVVLSLEQTALLESESPINSSIHLKELIQQRQELMNEISMINEKARGLQVQISQALNVKAFNFTELKPRIKTDEFQALQQALAQIAEILKVISQNDLKNQTLMRQATTGANTQPRANNQQASNAYRQAMKQKKN